MTVDFTTEEKELAQWLEEVHFNNLRKCLASSAMLKEMGFTVDENKKAAWLLTAKKLQEILYKKDEVIADRLYDINRRISLNCIAMKKGITPSQARVINLALGDIIKDLRKSHFLRNKECPTLSEASVNTEDESKRKTLFVDTKRDSSECLNTSDLASVSEPRNGLFPPLNSDEFKVSQPLVASPSSPDGLEVSPKGVCKCGHEMKEHRFYPGNSTSLCKGNYPDCNCTEYEGER